MTCTNALHLSTKWSTLARDAAGVVGGSLLIALSAQIAIPLPISPVPVTAQTLITLLAGAWLGPRRGAMCLLAYLAQGLAGLPFFAGGTAGLAHLVGPTGGYLVGLVGAAFVAGWLSEKIHNPRAVTTLLAMLLAHAVVYLLGLPWLALFVGRDVSLLLAAGLLPFIPGDLAKVILATAFIHAGRNTWNGKGSQQLPSSPAQDSR